MTQTMNLYGFGLYAALAALALLAGTSLLGKWKGLASGTASLFCAMAIPGAVLLGRLLYLALNFSLYTETFENPALMLCFWDGGLSMTGAVAGVILAGLAAAKISHQRFAALADAFSAPLGLSLCLLYLANRFTDLGIGKSIDESFLTRCLPWLTVTEKMGTLTVYNLCPWKYEAIAFLILAILTVFLFHRLRALDGDTALVFFSLAGAVTILFESMRDDGHMLIIFLRVGQLGGAAMILISLIVLSLRFRKAGGSRKWVLLAWLGELVALGGNVLIEFALDGRLAFGAKSMGLNYLAMLGCCVLMAALPCLLRAKQRKLEGKA